MNASARRYAWLLLALPGLLQLLLLSTAMWARFSYPYDLEWMEGGMLSHALEMQRGRSLYRPPSVEFIPYLYTPLYPAVLAGLGGVFGLSYQLGRAISILSTVGILVLGARAVTREAGEGERGPALAGAVMAWGLFAACYPWVECFYDLVRGDMLFLAIGTGGLVALRAWAPGARGFLDGHVAIAAALLAMSFFAKQTGVLLVLAGGAALVVMNWRALPLYAAVSAAIGLGGSLAYKAATGGWYWVYAYQVHQNHDTHMPRFWESFGHILKHFPVMTGVVGLGLCAVALCAVVTRRLPQGGAGFLYWAWLYACGTVIGAIGWSTQWAVFNAFIPAMAFGAIAAGAAVAPICAAAAALSRLALARTVAGVVVLGALAAQLLSARWDPRWSAPVGDKDAKVKPPPPWQVLASVRPFVPAARDRAAGDRLIARLAGYQGEIFFPSHPWYARLAGKDGVYAHRMGVKDVTFELPCQVTRRMVRVGTVGVVLPCIGKGPALPREAKLIAGMVESMRAGRFAAVVLDHGEQPGEYPGMAGAYKVDARLGPDEGPRVFSGKPTVPGQILVPARP